MRPDADSNPDPPTRSHRTLAHALIVLAAACAIYFPLLAYSGLAHSEGFRAFPGWEMLDSGNWTIPHLFTQPYLRKPPLVPWAHAIFGWLFGRNEFSARAVSSTAIVASCMICFGYAQRWFGRPWGLVAGLAYALMPLNYWYPPGRGAEIEPVHNLFTFLTVCLVLDIQAGGKTDKRGAPVMGGILRTWAIIPAFAAMLLTKGPVGVPVLLAAFLAVRISTRSWIRALWPGVIISLIAGVLLAGQWYLAVKVALQTISVPPIEEPATKFLFRPGELFAVVLLPVTALATAMPNSISLFFLPWRAPEPAVAVTSPDSRRTVIACSLAWTVAISLAIYTVMGISNQRYTSPSLVLLPLCMGAAGWRRCAVPLAIRTTERAFILLHARRSLVILCIIAVVQIAWGEYRRATRTSGKPDALQLGDLLVGKRADHIEIWGDQMVDARPEVLWYACERAYQHGQFVTPRWIPYRGDGPAFVPPPGSYLIIRTDHLSRRVDEEPELPRFEAAGVTTTWPLIYVGKAHNFEYRVYQSPPESTAENSTQPPSAP